MSFPEGAPKEYFPKLIIGRELTLEEVEVINVQIKRDTEGATIQETYQKAGRYPFQRVFPNISIDRCRPIRGSNDVLWFLTLSFPGRMLMENHLKALIQMKPEYEAFCEYYGLTYSEPEVRAEINFIC